MTDTAIAMPIHDVSATLCHRATLVTASDGGPLRTIVTGGAMHPTGLYSSAKTGRGQPWKHWQEQDRIIACEADPRVRSYLAQPHRLDFHPPGGPVSFFPDLRVDYRSGEVAIELVSHDVRLVGRDTVQWAREVYDALGWTFVDRRGERNAQVLALATAKRIAADRWTRLDAANVLAARQAVADAGGEVAYGILVEALGGLPLGPARLHALVVAGHLALDPSGPIRNRTPVRLQHADGRQ